MPICLHSKDQYQQYAHIYILETVGSAGDHDGQTDDSRDKRTHKGANHKIQVMGCS